MNAMTNKQEKQNYANDNWINKIEEIARLHRVYWTLQSPSSRTDPKT